MIVTTTAPTVEELNLVAINRIVDQVSRLSRDKTFHDIWKEVYEPAKGALRELNLSTEDYQAAIARLTEAMRV